MLSLKETVFGSKDFPFLGSQLVDLQGFVIDQNPSGLRALWHDCRDISKSLVRDSDQLLTLNSAVSHFLSSCVCGWGLIVL